MLACRTLTGRRQHRFWEPRLDPPALLADISVVLVSPKRPVSIGTAARALSCFECQDLRLVQPRCDHLARGSRNSSKGAQYLLFRSRQFNSLEAALEDAAVSVAFTRWVAGRPGAFQSIVDLLAAPWLAAALAQQQLPSTAAGLEPAGVHQTADAQLLQPGRGRLVLVFGREERGFDPGELDHCDFTCSIPIGRLQESLSLSHAVSIVLSQLFQLRQRESGRSLPASMADLAGGYKDQGLEH